MKILFVYTDIDTMGLGARSYHLGIGMLSAVLKKAGHKIGLVCMRQRLKLKDLIKKVSIYKPDIVALTSDTTQLSFIKQVIQTLSHLDIFTILGGVHASLCPKCLSDIPNLDSICVGEGEFSLLELVNNFSGKPLKYNIDGIWFKAENGIIENKTRPFITNLDELPFADREIFGYQKIINSDYGRASFMLSRGCPFACTYCASPAMGKLQDGKYVRFMSVRRAIDELKDMKRSYRFKSIFFADDTFTINKAYVQDFCEQYKKKIGMPFEVNSRVEASSKEIFKALKQAGCFKVHIGIESGHQEFRQRVLNRKMTNDQIIEAFDNARRAGLLTKSYNIVGFPYEDLIIHQATLELNRKINPDGHVCYIFQPYPGTELYDICKREGFINAAFDKNRTISRRGTSLNMPNFAPSDIVKAHRNFSFDLYKNRSLKEALVYRLYYSRYGEVLLFILRPLRNILRKIFIK